MNDRDSNDEGVRPPLMELCPLGHPPHISPGIRAPVAAGMTTCLSLSNNNTPKYTPPPSSLSYHAS
jgi:hypothetical protein